ncbi:carbohydrate porin [Camelimonas abortus]|uniref:Carbohydrate porin n=1 Tax=Camelimonas abortus TaxID=1017184 RepID=A0ABV7LI02_9HYPH
MSRTVTIRNRGAALARAGGLALLALAGADAAAGAAEQEGARRRRPPEAEAPAGDALAGLSWGMEASADLMANARGGRRRAGGAALAARPHVDADLEALAGWRGASLHAGIQLAGGRGLAVVTGAFAPPSGAETAPTLRPAGIWLRQSLAGGALTLRAGHLLADSAFAALTAAGAFVNAGFGWPLPAAAALPGGGPAWPAAAPGVEAQARLAPAWTFRAGVYAGAPWRSGRWNRRGPGRAWRHGAFMIAELAGEGAGPGDLPGALKFGAWRATQRFPAPDAAPPAQRGHGLHGFHVAVEQTLWRGAGGGEVTAFGRLSWTPLARRAPVDLAIDAGVTVTGLLAARPDDVLAVGAVYARPVRSACADLERERLPVPELTLEASWRAAVTGGLSLQPFVQYVRRPGGGGPDALRPWRRTPDAVVVGLRTSTELPAQ